MSESGPGDVTRLLADASGGDRDAEARLMSMVYGELRVIAASRLPSSYEGGTLGATMLVNECWIRLSPKGVAFEDRRHFYRLAALAMRDLVVEHFRRRGAQKRGGDLERVALSEIASTDADGADRSEAFEARRRLDAAITGLEAVNPEAHEVVLLRFYADQPYRVIAELMEMPEIRVRRLWKLAQARLNEALTATSPPGRRGDVGHGTDSADFSDAR